MMVIHINNSHFATFTKYSEIRQLTVVATIPVCEQDILIGSSACMMPLKPPQGMSLPFPSGE